MDTLALQLTEGPQGYKITLKNMEAFGASNFKVTSLKLSEGSEPFKAKIVMPKLKIEAKYTSSGVLLILPASGGGDFHANFEGVSADLTGKTSIHAFKGANYLHIDALSLVLDVKDVKMSISGAFNNNRILRKCPLNSLPKCEISISFLISQWRPPICFCGKTLKSFWRLCRLNCRKNWLASSANSPTSS